MEKKVNNLELLAYLSSILAYMEENDDDYYSLNRDMIGDIVTQLKQLEQVYNM